MNAHSITYLIGVIAYSGIYSSISHADQKTRIQAALDQKPPALHITETQKHVARVHRIPNEMLATLWKE